MSNPLIIVGVDGSEGSRRALRWGLAEARLRGHALEVITAWPSRDLVAKAQLLDANETQQVAAATQQRVIDEELSDFPNPPSVSYQVVHGDPVEALLTASSSAELLVVGSHNTSTISHVMLGSVSEACARMAECPVVVLPMGTPAQYRADVATVSDADDNGRSSEEGDSVPDET